MADLEAFSALFRERYNVEYKTVKNDKAWASKIKDTTTEFKKMKLQKKSTNNKSTPLSMSIKEDPAIKELKIAMDFFNTKQRNLILDVGNLHKQLERTESELVETNSHLERLNRLHLNVSKSLEDNKMVRMFAYYGNDREDDNMNHFDLLNLSKLQTERFESNKRD